MACEQAGFGWSWEMERSGYPLGRGLSKLAMDRWVSVVIEETKGRVHLGKRNMAFRLSLS